MGKLVQKKQSKKPVQKETAKFVSQKAERGQGLKFKLETVATVAAFKPGTKIKYGPNPKRPGSKSFTRYAGYAKAKTVGESFKLGVKLADFLWELERGDYKIVGGERTESQEIAAIGKDAFQKAQRALGSFIGPRGLSMDIHDPRAAAELAKEEAWRAERQKRCEALAKQLGLRVESPEEIEASNESADVRLQRRVTDALSAEKLSAGRKITDADVAEALSVWGFCQNTGRLNVLPEGRKYVYSDTLGAIRRRTGGFGITPPTSRYPNFPKLLCKWLADNSPKVACKFVCSAININANYAGKRHRDQNNEGPSAIRAFGKFKGGKLMYWPGDVKKASRPGVETLAKKDAKVFDLSKATQVFDGNRAHEVEGFEGERYSIVFFTARGYGSLKKPRVNFLKQKAGFPWPTTSELAKLKKATTAV